MNSSLAAMLKPTNSVAASTLPSRHLPSRRNTFGQPSEFSGIPSRQHSFGQQPHISVPSRQVSFEQASNIGSAYSNQVSFGKPLNASSAPPSQWSFGQPSNVCSAASKNVSFGQPSNAGSAASSQVYFGQSSNTSSVPNGQVTFGQQSNVTGAPSKHLYFRQPFNSSAASSQVSFGQPSNVCSAPSKNVNFGQPLNTSNVASSQVYFGQPTNISSAPNGQVSFGQPSNVSSAAYNQVSFGQPSNSSSAAYNQVSFGQPSNTSSPPSNQVFFAQHPVVNGALPSTRNISFGQGLTAANIPPRIFNPHINSDNTQYNPASFSQYSSFSSCPTQNTLNGLNSGINGIQPSSAPFGFSSSFHPNTRAPFAPTFPNNTAVSFVNSPKQNNFQSKQFFFNQPCAKEGANSNQPALFGFPSSYDNSSVQQMTYGESHNNDNTSSKNVTRDHASLGSSPSTVSSFQPSSNLVDTSFGQPSELEAGPHAFIRDPKAAAEAGREADRRAQEKASAGRNSEVGTKAESSTVNTACVSIGVRGKSFDTTTAELSKAMATQRGRETVRMIGLKSRTVPCQKSQEERASSVRMGKQRARS